MYNFLYFEIFRSAVWKQNSVQSYVFLFDFIIGHSQLGVSDVNILSLHKGMLLISGQCSQKILIYNFEGRLLSTIKINVSLQDASWTPRGKIVYITFSTRTIVTILESGKVINHIEIVYSPLKLSVSSDGIIYLTVSETGVFQSIDDGINWSILFRSVGYWHIQQVIKVASGGLENLWSIDRNCRNSLCNHSMRIYNVERRGLIGSVKWKDVSLFTPAGKHINLAISDLTYDGISNVFLSECFSDAIHVFSVTGYYHSQLLLMDCPQRMIVDKDQQILFVGHQNNITALKLNYEAKVRSFL